MNLESEIVRQFGTVFHTTDFPEYIIFGDSPYNPDFFDNFNLIPNRMYLWAEVSERLNKVFFTEIGAYSTVPPLIAWGTHSILLTSFHENHSQDRFGTLFWYVVPRFPTAHYPVFGPLP